MRKLGWGTRAKNFGAFVKNAEVNLPSGFSKLMSGVGRVRAMVRPTRAEGIKENAGNSGDPVADLERAD
jgi:hypothetical protein